LHDLDRPWNVTLPCPSARFAATASIRAGVQAGDRAHTPNRLSQLGDVETRPAAHVQDAVAGPCAQRSPHQLAPTQHIARRIEPLQPLDQAPIEFQLTHFRLTVPSM
jgi:hypothetical protein